MKNLSPADFYSVRNALGLSLSTVAKESEINRNYLSNFEKKKYILDDTAKVKLREYYLSIDPDAFAGLGDSTKVSSAADEENEREEATNELSQAKASAVSLLSEMGYRLVDGRYVVPSETDEDLIEDEREEMQLIDLELNELLSQKAPVRRGFLSGESLDEDLSLSLAVKAISLIARKQLHHDRMQGFSTITPVHVNDDSIFSFSDDELDEVRVHHLVSRLIHPDNQLPQPE